MDKENSNVEILVIRLLKHLRIFKMLLIVIVVLLTFNLLKELKLMVNSQPLNPNDAMYITEYCLDDLEDTTEIAELEQMKCKWLGQPNEGPVKYFYLAGTSDTPAQNSTGQFVNRIVYKKQYNWGNVMHSYERPCPANITKPRNPVGQMFDYGHEIDLMVWSCGPWEDNPSTIECENMCLKSNDTSDCHSYDADWYTAINATRPAWSSCVPTNLTACSNPSPLPACMCRYKCYDEKYFIIPDFYFITYAGDSTIPPENAGMLFTSFVDYNNVLELSTRRLKWHNTEAYVTIKDDPVINAFINLNDRILTIEVTPSLDYSVLITKDSYKDFRSFSGTHFELTLPIDVTASSGSISIKLYYLDNLIISKDFNILGRNVCVNYDCILCAQYWDYYRNCAPYTIQLFMIGNFVAIILLLLFSLYAALTFIIFIYNGLKLSFKISYNLLIAPAVTAYRFFSGKKKNSSDNAFYQFSEEDVSEQNTKPEVYKRRQTPGIVKYDKDAQGNLVRMVVIVALCLPLVLGCDHGAIIPVDIKTCVQNGNIESCSLNSEISFTLPYPGAKACLTILNNETGNIFGSLNVTFLESYRTMPMNQLYYTSDYEAHASSNHLCYSWRNDDFCSDNGACDSINTSPRNPIPPYGNTGPVILDPTANQAIGWSRCRRVSGCISNGCTLCTDACVVSRISLRPKGVPVQVFSLGSSSLTADMLIESSFSASSNITSNKCSIVGTPCSFKDFDFTIDTMTSNTILSLTDKVMIRGNEIKYGSATDANVLTAGNLGELQGRYSNSFSSNQFIAANNIFSVVDSGNQDTYTFTQPAVASTWSTLRTLPGVINGNFVNVNNLRAYVNLTDGQITGRLTFSKKIVVSRVISIVCPAILDASITGCSLCDSGAIISLNASSSCSSGLALVKTDDESISVHTSSVQLSQSASNFQVFVSLSKRQNDFNLILISGSKSSSFHLTIDALPGIDTRNDTTVSVNSTNTNESNNVSLPDLNTSDFFRRTFSGVGSTLDIVFVALVLLGSLLTLLGLTFVVYRVFIKDSKFNIMILDKIKRTNKNK